VEKTRCWMALVGLWCALVVGACSTQNAQAAVPGYYAQAGKIYQSGGAELQLRGISHHGFNAQILQPEYLWEMGWKEQIAQIKSLGFNAVRLPFVPATLYVTTTVDQLSYVQPVLNADLIGKTPLQVMDLWMAEANRQGLYVLLDFHSVSSKRQYPTWYVANPVDYGLTWNQQAYTAENWRRDLAFVAQRYAHLSHFFAIDVYNEPTGMVRWSTGDTNSPDPANIWKAAVESAAAAVLQANPKLLIFVQGIAGNFDGIEDSSVPVNWGEDFQPQAYQPLAISAEKLVLSPHTYGPDVFVKSSFNAANYPANLAAGWETLFGQFSTRHPVVLGEWGGRYGQGGTGQADVQWQNALVDYLLSKGIRSSFYWCYTPNSGDTGGILDDNLRVREDKMALLRRHWGSAVATPAPAPIPAPVPVPTAPPAPTPTPAPGSGYVQPSISSFAPASGPVGTVVTIQGAGFTGLNLAWVGAAQNASVSVISNTQVRVTIPTGATTGAIGLFNPSHVAFTASSFIVTAAPTTGGKLTYLRPTISSYSPASGPVGTVVTMNGTGFTGLTAAWVGVARNAAIQVLSDKLVKVTIPAGGTSGAIRLVNPKYSVLTPGYFKVTAGTAAAAPTVVQPMISSFSPASGKVGTVVTVSGSGFNGLNAAWVGAAHNAGVSVVSNTQVRVTVPAGATTGAIGIFNPKYTSFTASPFTVVP